MKLINALTKIGLTEKQARVYMACLELGGARVNNIAKKAEVQRTTCYHVINDLINLGLVAKSKQKKAGFFVAEEPQTIEKRTKERLQIVQEILPQLQAVHNILPQTPKISFYEGWEGAKLVYENSLKTMRPGDTILSFSSFEEFDKYLQKPWSVDYFTEKRMEKKIRARIIAPASPAAERLKRNALKELRDIKIVPAENYHFTTDMKIYGNRVGIISFKENFMSVLIESKEIAEMMKMAFELMWQGANAKS